MQTQVIIFVEVVAGEKTSESTVTDTMRFCDDVRQHQWLEAFPHCGPWETDEFLLQLAQEGIRPARGRAAARRIAGLRKGEHMTVIDESRAYSVSDTEGNPYWFAGALMVSKASSDQTGGAFAMLDQTVPGGYAPPRHVHRAEDEAWYLLRGTVTFYCGSRTLTAQEGSFVFLPRGVEHAFKVAEDGARMLTLTVPASFGDFVAAAGEPAPQLTPPPSGPPDAERLARLGAQFGIDITGPPPE